MVVGRVGSGEFKSSSRALRVTDEQTTCRAERKGTVVASDRQADR